MRTRWSLALLLAVCVPPAAAQNETPAPEMDQLAPLLGTWSCETTNAGDEDGAAPSTRSTITVARDLDGFWFSGRVVADKTRDDSKPMTRLFFWSFDQTRRDFVGGWLDNRGAWLTCTSNGWKDGLLRFLGHVVTGAGRRTARETFTLPNDEGFDHTFELLNVNPNQWVGASREHCRKTATPAP